MFPERPGYKWLTFSKDSADTWSDPVPLACTQGEPIESSGTRSVVFRSIKNDRIYWIGNLCTEGERPNGNWPRSPFLIAEIQEETFALKRETITVIDRRSATDSPMVRMSNFLYYQDRQNGEIVIFLVRHGEFSVEQYSRANYYRYRIEL